MTVAQPLSMMAAPATARPLTDFINIPPDTNTGCAMNGRTPLQFHRENSNSRMSGAFASK
jgi:hypothetical protein